ncbi:MAG: single-stranded-DNA-specific exonuclease RecJ [Tissierellia bacterium]|nr:single-stranded-DNA-specific exonuclease RecJ [Tissierellia bacterium]
MERWFIKNNGVDPLIIAKDLGINEIISKILINRDIIDYKDIEMFLNPKLESLHSPTLMMDLELGASIIKEKIEKNKKIRIVGDFDVDGVISVYILYISLKKLGANVDFTIPDRVQDGYGINNEIIQKAKQEGVDTIITCDNGISAIEQVKKAKELGLTMIITDHHDLPYIEEDGVKKYTIPEADAVINPKRLDCDYPFKKLCGAGVAYKLIQQIHFLFHINPEETHLLLEFVAIATVCDVVDLVDENRIIVKKGLELINKTKNIGLKNLIIESGINNSNITAYHLGFVIGPTINASGRLESALLSLELLMEKEEDKAAQMAKNLRSINEERKRMTSEGLEGIIEKIEQSSLKNDKILVIFEPEIHESIAGIIAGRIKELYYKPTIVLTKGLEGVKGSGRSIEEYNMFEELTKCKELLNRFGGHPMAAGLTLDEDNIDKLKIHLNSNTTLSNQDLIPKIYIDMGLPMEYINYGLVEELKDLEPFGKGNSKPIFGEKSLKINSLSILGINKNVLKLKLESKKGTTMEGMYFGDIEEFQNRLIFKYGKEEMEKASKDIKNKVLLDIVYNPNINEYMGNTKLQLIIQKYRF